MGDYDRVQDDYEQDVWYIWRCPRCGWEHRDMPGYNEHPQCPNCRVECEFYAEEYPCERGRA